MSAKSLILFFLLVDIFVSSQVRFITGVDSGFARVKTKTETEKFNISSKWNNFQRTNFFIENKFNNNLLVSLNGGYDFHVVYFESEYINNSSPTKNVLTVYNYKTNLSLIRIGLSLGYEYCFSKKHSFFIKADPNIFLINRKSIKHAEQTNSFYKKSEEISNSPPKIYEEKKMIDLVDYRDFDNISSISSSNFNYNFKLGYRFHLSEWLIGANLGYSPSHQIFIQQSQNNNTFVVGLRLGYTFPQKDKNDEK